MRLLKRLWVPVLFVGYVLLALSVSVGKHGLLHLWQLRQEQHALEAKAFDLSRENEDFRDRIVRFTKDDEFFEKLVREDLKFIKKGEVLYVFRGPAETADPAETAETTESAETADP
jgi:cell division protein FtsB